MYFMASVQENDTAGAKRWLISLLAENPKSIRRISKRIIQDLRECPAHKRRRIPFGTIESPVFETFSDEALVLAAFAARESGCEVAVERCAREIRTRGARLREPALFEAFTAHRESDMVAALNRGLPVSFRFPYEFQFSRPLDLFRAASSVRQAGGDGRDGPLISVIMSSFNSSETIGYAINSIISQTYGNWELIVVDDCSTDDTANVVEGFRDRRIRMIRNGENAGPYVSRNNALKIAKGSFIAIQDADDSAHPMRLSFQMSILEKTDCVASTTGHVRIDRNNRLRVENEGRILGNAPVTLLCRRSVFDRIGVFKSVRTRGDIEFNGRVKAIYGEMAFNDSDMLLLLSLHSEASNSHLMNHGYDRKKVLQSFRRAFRLEHAEMARESTRIVVD